MHPTASTAKNYLFAIICQLGEQAAADAKRLLDVVLKTRTLTIVSEATQTEEKRFSSGDEPCRWLWRDSGDDLVVSHELQSHCFFWPHTHVRMDFCIRDSACRRFSMFMLPPLVQARDSDILCGYRSCKEFQKSARTTCPNGRSNDGLIWPFQLDRSPRCS